MIGGTKTNFVKVKVHVYVCVERVPRNKSKGMNCRRLDALYHETIQAPLAATHVRVATTSTDSSTSPGNALQPPTTPLLGNAGKVVTKALVGSGAPLTVTVGTALLGDKAVLFGVPPAARTVNLGEVAYITPCVEFMKTRK